MNLRDHTDTFVMDLFFSLDPLKEKLHPQAFVVGSLRFVKNLRILSRYCILMEDANLTPRFFFEWQTYR